MADKIFQADIDFYVADSFKETKLLASIIDLAADITHVPFMHAFKTIEGEGGDVGRPRVLARLSGCGIGCNWCDSRYTWAPISKKAKLWLIEDVIVQIETVANGLKEISISGGDPMHFPGQVYAIAKRLKAKGYYLNMETGGLMLSNEVFALFDTVGIDIKGPSSGVIVNEENIHRIKQCTMAHHGIQLKMVISDKNDLDWLKTHFDDLLHGDNRGKTKPIILTPCATADKNRAIDSHKLQEIFDLIIDWNDNYNIRAVPQMHKMVTVDPHWDS